MSRKIPRSRRPALAAALLACLAGPALAQSDGPPGFRPPLPPGQQGQPGQPGQPAPEAQPKKKHHSGIGAAIGAGVVGGLVGGALLNGQRQAPGYPPQPAYAPPPPPPPAYDVDDEPECRVVRKPVYDEDGEIVDYRTRRICR